MENKEKLFSRANINARLIDAIKYCGMSQKELASKAHITSSTLSDYIHKGKLPSLDTFYMLCIAMDMSSDEILGLKD